MNCKNCGAPYTEVLTPPPHYAKRVCPECGTFGGWVPKPENKDKRRDKNTTWRSMWEKRGYRCGICGATKDDFPVSGQWQLDHIIQLEAGGADEFDNTMMVCTFCHTIKNVEQKRRIALTKPRDQKEAWESKGESVPW